MIKLRPFEWQKCIDPLKREFFNCITMRLTQAGLLINGRVAWYNYYLRSRPRARRNRTQSPDRAYRRNYHCRRNYTNEAKSRLIRRRSSLKEFPSKILRIVSESPMVGLRLRDDDDNRQQRWLIVFKVGFTSVLIRHSPREEARHRS